MIAIGVGCRSGQTAYVFCEAVARILALVTLPDGAKALYSLDSKRDEAGLISAAAQLGLPLRFFSREALARFNGRGTVRSALSQQIYGLDSVAEAAALAGAGAGARLLVPRHNHAGVTCALAVGEG